VDCVLDIRLRAEMELVCDPEFQGTDRNHVVTDPGRHRVFEGRAVELVARELDFEMWRDLVVRGNPDVIAVVDYDSAPFSSYGMGKFYLRSSVQVGNYVCIRWAPSDLGGRCRIGIPKSPPHSMVQS